jgi:hypothetical protein
LNGLSGLIKNIMHSTSSNSGYSEPIFNNRDKPYKQVNIFILAG